MPKGFGTCHEGRRPKERSPPRPKLPPALDPNACMQLSRTLSSKSILSDLPCDRVHSCSPRILFRCKAAIGRSQRSLYQKYPPTVPYQHLPSPFRLPFRLPCKPSAESLRTCDASLAPSHINPATGRQRRTARRRWHLTTRHPTTTHHAARGRVAASKSNGIRRQARSIPIARRTARRLRPTYLETTSRRPSPSNTFGVPVTQ